MVTLPSPARPPTTGIYPIIAKLRSDNQLTIPDEIFSAFPDVECFEVSVEEGKIVLTPVPITPADEVRQELAALGITETDVDDAIEWARRQ